MSSVPHLATGRRQRRRNRAVSCPLKQPRKIEYSTPTPSTLATLYVQIAHSDEAATQRNKEMDEYLYGPDWRTVAVSPQAISKSTRFQPRHGLDDATVGSYAYAMRRGDVFPPVRIAAIGDQLELVDGFHRVAAAQQAGVTELTAEVAPMTEQMATQEAIVANAKHGLPLRRRDKQRCFELYRDGGLHRQPDGKKTKSLRQICRDLGYIVWPNTVRRWLRQSNIEVVEDGPVDRSRWEEPPVSDPLLMEDLDVQLGNVERLFQTIQSPETRADALERVRALLGRLESTPADKPVLLDI